MANIALSEARVKALRPRPSTYDIRDAKLRLVFDSVCGYTEAQI